MDFQFRSGLSTWRLRRWRLLSAVNARRARGAWQVVRDPSKALKKLTPIDHLMTGGAAGDDH